MRCLRGGKAWLLCHAALFTAEHMRDMPPSAVILLPPPYFLLFLSASPFPPAAALRYFYTLLMRRDMRLRARAITIHTCQKMLLLIIIVASYRLIYAFIKKANI